jgi:hypothetical protein
MKKFILPIIIAASSLISQTASAQISVSVQFGTPAVRVYRPAPQPAVVYDDFYYLPDVEAYYSVPEHCYYYMDGRRWVSAAYLPGRYHDYDWRYARRYQVRAVRPYEQHNVYRNRYGSNWRGDWNDDRYYADRGRNRYNDQRDPRQNYDRRMPDSPYDSNNTWGRDRRFNDDRVNAPFGGRGQGQQRGQGSDSYNGRQRDNYDGGRNSNDRQQNNNGRGNDGNGREQNHGNAREGRLQMAGIQRVSF